jgi:hypothetical protein
MPGPITAQDQLPRSSSQSSGRVEQWIEDQRGEDLDPTRLSPMPRHSDTIVHSRRRSPAPQQDASDFVFVDDDEEVSTREKSPMEIRVLTGYGIPLFLRTLELDTARNGAKPKISVPRWSHFRSIQRLFFPTQELEDVVHTLNKESVYRKSQ